MKTIQTFLLAFVLIFSFAGTCSNDDDDAEQAVDSTSGPIVGRWKLTGSISYGVDIFNLASTAFQVGTNGESIYGIEECTKDDTFTFTSTEWIINYGSLCFPSQSPTVTSFYTIDANKTLFTFTTSSGNQSTKTILLLNDTTLKFETNSGRFVQTYTKQ